MTPVYTLRPAGPGDFPAIRALIHKVHINPLGLDWRRFVVAVDPHGQIIACGQVKPHGDGLRELASIAVEPEWQRQGIASAIIRHLQAEHPGVLYLTCRARLEPFYEPFGFRAIGRDEMPPYYRRISRIASLIYKLRFTQNRMLVMKRER